MFNILTFSLAAVAIGQGDAESAPTAAATDAPSAYRCYEGFDYPPFDGNLLGKSGGVGFEGPWVAAGFNASNPEAYRIVAGSLDSSDLLADAGYVRTEASEAMTLQSPFRAFAPPVTYQPIKGIGRRWARPIEATETTTLYIAALLRPERAAGEDAFGGYIGFYLDGTGNNDLFVGVGGENQPNYCLENRGGSRQVISEHIAVSGRTDLLVVKAEFKPGPDVFTLYVNPDLHAAEPLTGTVKCDLDIGRFDQLVLYSTGAFSMDRLLITDSFAALAERPNCDELQGDAPVSEETPRLRKGDAP